MVRCSQFAAAFAPIGKLGLRACSRSRAVLPALYKSSRLSVNSGQYIKMCFAVCRMLPQLHSGFRLGTPRSAKKALTKADLVRSNPTAKEQKAFDPPMTINGAPVRLACDARFAAFQICASVHLSVNSRACTDNNQADHPAAPKVYAVEGVQDVGSTSCRK